LPRELIPAALQAVLASAAGVALWIAWRAVSRVGDLSRVGDSWATRLVAAGFLLRAAAGVTLFWISYLRLPVMTTHYLGGGFWDFALDSDDYMALAGDAASRGPLALLTLDRGKVSSVAYVQIVAVAQILFGRASSVGLLLDCACFLAAALALVRWSASLGAAGRSPGLLALVVLSLHPSWILWSTQPLKDALFGLLVIAWFCASRCWFEGSEPGARGRPALWALVLAMVLYELAGLRAYFALVLWLAFGAGLALSLLRPSPLQPSSRRRWRRVVAGASLWILLSQVVVWSGGPLLPSTVRAVLMPYGSAPAPESPATTSGEQASGPLLRPLAKMREGFVTSGAASQISAGAPEPVVAPPGPPPATSPISPPVAGPRPGWSRTLLAGLAATFLPRVVGSSLGLFSIGGGRGAWAYVELDTLFFTTACVLSVLLTVRAARRAGRISPLALQAMLSALLIAVALAYVVAVFGTLFRLREMILMPLSLAPLAATVRRATGRETAARAPE